jgi:integrase
VSTTAVGSEMDPGNVRRDLRRALKLVPGLEPKNWTPRELRHSFVSRLSDAGVPIEMIAAGRPTRHYRHQDRVSASNSAGHSNGSERNG